MSKLLTSAPHKCFRHKCLRAKVSCSGSTRTCSKGWTESTGAEKNAY